MASFIGQGIMNHQPLNGTNAPTIPLSGHRAARQSSRLEMLRPLRSSLIERDYARLESCLQDDNVPVLLRRYIRTKLADAVIIRTDQTTDRVASCGSVVRYTIGQQPPQMALLLASPPENDRVPVIPVFSFLGAALIGLRAGQYTPLLQADGTVGYAFLQGFEF
ncbi:MAG: hypothetical protein ABID63_07760 [Pseudomonadota bacterium]